MYSQWWSVIRSRYFIAVNWNVCLWTFMYAIKCLLIYPWIQYCTCKDKRYFRYNLLHVLTYSYYQHQGKCGQSTYITRKQTLLCCDPTITIYSLIHYRIALNQMVQTHNPFMSYIFGGCLSPESFVFKSIITILRPEIMAMGSRHEQSIVCMYPVVWDTTSKQNSWWFEDVYVIALHH